MAPIAAQDRALTALIREVRSCFNQLKTLAERLHEDLGVNPSMRAVMESLAAGGAQTVPEIARSKGVSRQHIQSIMNVLLADGLVEARDNPAHRRSPRFELTRRGRATFATIAGREQAPLRRIAAALPVQALCDAREALVRLNAELATEIAKGEAHEGSR